MHSIAGMAIMTSFVYFLVSNFATEIVLSSIILGHSAASIRIYFLD